MIGYYCVYIEMMILYIWDGFMSLIFLLMLKSKEVDFLKFIVNIIDMLSYV